MHAEPIVYTVRLYEDGGDFDHRSRFVAVVTIIKTGRDRVWACGLEGSFSRRHWREINDWLKGIGIKTLEMERGGQVVVRHVR